MAGGHNIGAQLQGGTIDAGNPFITTEAGHMMGYGSAAPTAANAGQGWAKGAQFMVSGLAASSTNILTHYINVGTTSTASWKAVTLTIA